MSWVRRWSCAGLLILALGLPARNARAGDAPAARPAGVQIQLDVVIAEVRPGLTHTFISGLREPTDGPASAAGARQPSKVFFHVLESPRERRAFLGFLSALKQEGLAGVLSEPRLVTLNGRPASFLCGGERAVPMQDGKGQVGVRFEEFGTRLNFLPIVLGNGKIRLGVEPEISRLDPASGKTVNGVSVPNRITDRVNTTVELKDGQTFVLGGLVQRQVSASAQRVPVLGDVPYLGDFFTSKSYTATEKELVILITPTVISPGVAPQQNKKASDGTTPEVRASLQRLERELKHLRQEVGALRREPRSRPAAESATSGER
jgi:Flp pilus assembly secretin CpaC